MAPGVTALSSPPHQLCPAASRGGKGQAHVLQIGATGAMPSGGKMPASWGEGSEWGRPQKGRGLCRSIRCVTDGPGCLACGGLQGFFPPTLCCSHTHLPHGGLRSTPEGKGHAISIFGAGLKIMGSPIISLLGRGVAPVLHLRIGQGHIH